MRPSHLRIGWIIIKNFRTKKHIVDLGRKLHIKITKVISAEFDEIAEEDCINYMLNLVINRTFDGYIIEIKTIYGQLVEILGVKIDPALDKWEN